MIVGIDLGTTHSLIGIWRDGKTEIIPNSLGQTLTPSVVGLGEDQQIIVGAVARERLVTHPELTAANFKRYMGTNRQIKLGHHEMRPEELSAFVLKSLKADAEAYLGESVLEAVITVPAYFSDAQRKATKAAGELAGFKVERLLNEPTAAAMAYGLHQNQDQKVLVFDLGGGTFDVSILELFEGVMEVHASAGDNFLGGEDFTEALTQHFLRTVDAFDRGTSMDKVPEAFIKAVSAQAERAKRKLSEEKEAEMRVLHEGEELCLTVDTEVFEKVSETLLNRISDPIRRALRDANTRSKELDEIVLVGGATRMPIVRQLATRLFQRFPSTQLHPDEVVAHGAAIQAGLKARDAALDEVVMTDVSPYTLGIEVVLGGGNQQQDPGHFLPIIERNTYIPVSRVKTVYTVHDEQQHIDVRIFQGESPLVKDNVFLGNLYVPVPLNKASQEHADIRFTYDINGILEAEVTIGSTNEKFTLVIEKNPGVLSQAEIQERLLTLSKMKVHPRDKMENQFLIACAERLYQELLGDSRLRIGEQLAIFRQTLETQDDPAIRRSRAEFKELLNSFEMTV